MELDRRSRCIARSPTPISPNRLAEMAATAGLPTRLRNLGVPQEALPSLAEEAAAQWTGRFNPRPFGAAAALEVYQATY
jgi:alcohol dehydrogenase class IV